MRQPILITGAAGGQQGSTGRLVASLLLSSKTPFRMITDAAHFYRQWRPEISRW